MDTILAINWEPNNLPNFTPPPFLLIFNAPEDEEKLTEFLQQQIGVKPESFEGVKPSQFFDGYFHDGQPITNSFQLWSFYYKEMQTLKTINVIHFHDHHNLLIQELVSFPDTPEGNEAAKAKFVEVMKEMNPLLKNYDKTVTDAINTGVYWYMPEAVLLQKNKDF